MKEWPTNDTPPSLVKVFCILESVRDTDTFYQQRLVFPVAKLQGLSRPANLNVLIHACLIWALYTQGGLWSQTGSHTWQDQPIHEAKWNSQAAVWQGGPLLSTHWPPLFSSYCFFQDWKRKGAHWAEVSRRGEQQARVSEKWKPTYHQVRGQQLACHLGLQEVSGWPWAADLIRFWALTSELPLLSGLSCCHSTCFSQCRRS